jgi:hypothetical protein
MTNQSSPNRRWRSWRSRARFTMIATILILLSGCILEKYSDPPTNWSEPIDLGALLEAVASLQQADPKTLRDAASEVDSDDPSEVLGWALVMTALGEPADDARARQLLVNYLDHAGQSPGPTALATLLLDRLQSELRLKRRLDVAIRQRDDLNKRVVSSPARGKDEIGQHTLQSIIRERDELTAQLEELKASQSQARDVTLRATIRERDELTEQLEELKAIEIQIRDRKRDSELDLPKDPELEILQGNVK